MAMGRHEEATLLSYELNEDRAWEFQVQWRVDAKALAEWKKLEGVYVLKTSLSSRASPLAKTVAKYREQNKVERRFANLKGPLAVAPMFLKNPERIAGLLCILVWSLMLLALMERQVRRKLKGKPLYGLYPENRPSPSPTGPALLECFSTLCIVIVRQRGVTRRRLAERSDVQQTLLQLLDIPPDALRTFRRRCGM